MNIDMAEVVQSFIGLATVYGILAMVVVGLIGLLWLASKIFSWPIWDHIFGAVVFVLRYVFGPVVMVGIYLWMFLGRSVPRVLSFLGDYLPKVVAILATAFGPWLVIGWMLAQSGVPMGKILSLGIASSMLSLPICFVAWPILQRLDKKPLKLFHVPLVIFAAVFWLAPILLMLPMMAND